VRNPHEPEAELAAKGKNKVCVGSKVQVAETVSEEPLEKGEPTKEFLTAVVTQKAAESDETGLVKVLVEEKESGLETPEEMVVDGAYVSGESLRKAEQEGYELTGPAQEPGAKNPGFKSDTFHVDVGNRRAVCPAGLEHHSCTRSTATKTGKALYRFGWGEQCAGCPLKDLCLGKNQTLRSLEVGEYPSHLQQSRKDQKTEQFKEKMHRRSAIGGTQSEMVRGQGMRQARYRGLEKVRQQNYLIGAACNVKRWIKRMVWEMDRQVNCALAQATGAVAVRCKGQKGSERALGTKKVAVRKQERRV
jgi:transposase